MTFTSNVQGVTKENISNTITSWEIRCTYDKWLTWYNHTSNICRNTTKLISVVCMLILYPKYNMIYNLATPWKWKLILIAERWKCIQIYVQIQDIALSIKYFRLEYFVAYPISCSRSSVGNTPSISPFLDLEKHVLRGSNFECIVFYCNFIN